MKVECQQDNKPKTSLHIGPVCDFTKRVTVTSFIKSHYHNPSITMVQALKSGEGGGEDIPPNSREARKLHATS